MSYLAATPQAFVSAATDLAGIGSTLNSAHTAAAQQTTAVLPAAQDEVSAAISALFGNYAQGYQTLAGRAAAFHDQFVSLLNAGAGSYASAEAANASPLDRAVLVADVETATKAVDEELATLTAEEESINITQMFETQMLMNRLSQLAEMSTSVISATNSAIVSIARNVKS